VVQGHPADEAHLLGQIGSRTGGVEDVLIADRAAQQLVEGLLTQSAQQIVEARSTALMSLSTNPLRP
jgi:hypothetical protein